MMANSEQPSFSLGGNFGIVGAFNVAEWPEVSAHDPIQCSVWTQHTQSPVTAMFWNFEIPTGCEKILRRSSSSPPLWQSPLPGPGSWSSPSRTSSSRAAWCPGCRSTGCPQVWPGKPGPPRTRTATRVLPTSPMLMTHSPVMLKPLAGRDFAFF